MGNFVNKVFNFPISVWECLLKTSNYWYHYQIESLCDFCSILNHVKQPNILLSDILSNTNRVFWLMDTSEIYKRINITNDSMTDMLIQIKLAMEEMGFSPDASVTITTLMAVDSTISKETKQKLCDLLYRYKLICNFDNNDMPFHQNKKFIPTMKTAIRTEFSIEIQRLLPKADPTDYLRLSSEMFVDMNNVSKIEDFLESTNAITSNSSSTSPMHNPSSSSLVDISPPTLPIETTQSLSEWNAPIVRSSPNSTYKKGRKNKTLNNPGTVQIFT